MNDSAALAKEKNFVSVIVHLRNHGSYIRDFLIRLDRFLTDNFQSYEFIIVNNCSSDNSLEIVGETGNHLNGNVSIIDLPWVHNVETAMLAGLDLVIGDFVYEFDSPIIDFEEKDLWKVYEKCMEGYDVVAASPDKPMRLGARLFYTYLNRVSYRSMELKTETFRIASRRAINRILNSRQKTRYRKALYHYSGLETTNINYVPVSDLADADQISFIEKLGFAADILISYSDVGTRIATLVSIIFFILSILAAGYTTYSYFTYEGIQPGWTTTMLFLSGSFTGVFFVLALLSKYLVTILNELQDTPQYVYKSIVKLPKD